MVMVYTENYDPVEQIRSKNARLREIRKHSKLTKAIIVLVTGRQVI